MDLVAIVLVIFGLGGIVYAIADYEYTVSTKYVIVCNKPGSSCPLSAGVFEFSNIAQNFSIWLVLPISVTALCMGIFRRT